MELERYYDFQLLRDVAVSPGGDRVAFLVAEQDEGEDETRTALFVVPADGSREPHRLTRASDAGSPAWSPDGSKLGFVASRETDAVLRVGRAEDEEGDDAAESDDSGEGDDEPKPQVWVFDLERGGDARQVTDFEEGAAEFDWAPDGERIVVSARDPTDEQREYLDSRREGGPIEIERIQHKADGAGWLDEVETYLFVVDVETREVRRLDDAYGGGSVPVFAGLQPAWGPDDTIAFLSNRTERPDDSAAFDVFLIDADGGDARKLTDSGLRANGLRWSPDGERLSFVAMDATNWYGTGEVYVATPNDGEYGSVSDSLDRTPSWVGTAEWIDDATLVAPFADEGWTRLVRLRADGPDPERVFEAQGRNRTLRNVALGGGTVAAVLSDPVEGADVFALSASDLDAGEATRLSSLNGSLLADTDAPRCERVYFENGEGGEIEGIAYLPGDFDPEGSEPLPLIAAIHGGPMAYDAPSFGFTDRYWTNEGYAVLRVNYRGSTSYGRAFSESIRGDWGPREADDIISGVEEAVERGWADPDRLFVTGFSQGGINTAYVIARSDLFAAAAAEHGIYDFYSLYGTGDMSNWYENDVGYPWEHPEAYHGMSSIADVAEMDTPLLLTAGENDWRCPPTQAEQLYVSVRKRGVPAKLVIYPDEHHNVGAPERAIHRLRTLTEWFEEHDPATE